MGSVNLCNITGGTMTFTGGIPVGTSLVINYSYERQPYNRGIDVRGNRHVDLDRLAELQKLVAKHPNRTDLKMELMKLQKVVKPKVGKKKKK